MAEVLNRGGGDKSALRWTNGTFSCHPSIQVLAGWLNHSPNYDEVVKWYRGWKSVIPVDVLAAPQVKTQLTQALNMMNRVVSYSSGHPMAQQPGAVEAMAYLSSAEKDTMLAILQPQPPPPPPPPPTLSTATPELSSYKDLVARRCEERGILFAPTVPAKFFDGKQVFRYVKVIFDNRESIKKIEDINCCCGGSSF
jgi:tuftelin-interacting protein 11